MTNVFSDPLADNAAAVPRVPVQGMAVQGLLLNAINATSARPGNRPARILFLALDERGPAAWQHAALYLIQHACAMSDLKPGPEDAATYVMRQEPLDRALPAIALTQRVTAVYIRDGEHPALAVLQAAQDADVRGAVQHLFCLALVGVVSPDDLDRIIAALLADAA